MTVEIQKMNGMIDDYSKEQLYRMAFFEPVTRYYNWNWMRQILDDSVKYGVEDYSFVHFDIKDFRMINEIFGHATADRLLGRVCEAMSKCDWAYYSCRCDNDNFAMMAHKLPDEELREKLKVLFDGIASLDDVDDYPVFYRCGVASISNVLDFKATITDLAKMAQKMGNKANVTEIHFYTEQMKERLIRGKILKSELDHAIADGELLVYFQPKYNPIDDSLIGSEALIRWFHHHEKMLSPAEFVPFFEREGTIGKVDQFVLEYVCKKLEEWKHKGMKVLPVSVNMSRTQLYSPNMISDILSIVNKYDVDKSMIDFELTESAAFDDSHYMIEVMHQLREQGFQISIDDFGTGYSSLSLLSGMPLTTLKIDKSFIDNIEKDEDGKSRYIVQNMIDITKEFDIHCVAEGVETQGQLSLLKEWKCDYIQGYYYSKPVPVEDYEKLL